MNLKLIVNRTRVRWVVRAWSKVKVKPFTPKGYNLVSDFKL